MNKINKKSKSKTSSTEIKGPKHSGKFSESKNFSKYRKNRLEFEETWKVLSSNFANPSIFFKDESDEFSPKRGIPVAAQIRMLREWTKDVPVAGLLPAWEKNILKMIPLKLSSKYPRMLQDLLLDVKRRHQRVLKEFVKSTIVTGEEHQDHCGNVVPVRPMADHRKTFIKNRQLLKNRYFLSHPLIRTIIQSAREKLPRYLCDFRQYHGLGPLKLSDFKDMVHKELKKSKTLIKKSFYASTVDALRQIKGKPKTENFLNCATNVFVEQIRGLMMDTVELLTETLRDPWSRPLLQIRLICGDVIHLDPDIPQIRSTFQGVISEIGSIAEEMTSFEKCLKMKSEKEFVKVEIPEWFYESSRETLDDILRTMYEPLNDHLGRVVQEFQVLCSEETSQEIRRLMLRGTNFKVFRKHVEKYQSFKVKVHSMLTRVEYDFGRLVQDSAKVCLARSVEKIVDALVRELVVHHKQFNRQVCSEFENLRTKALSIPKNAQALFQCSEYISQASKVLVKELEKKVERSLEMLGSLIDITILTDEHLELNKTTINWIQAIKPVFARNNTLCEAMKSELEDELQRRINLLNVEVDETFPGFVILNDMDDASRVLEYTEHLGLFSRKIEALNRQVEWINLEERLFKFPETSFPRVDDVKDMILPFYSLVRLIASWQRDHAVWMDGPFEYLESEVIQRKTTMYFEEFTRIQKSFKVKIKADASANKSYRFLGIADDPDPMQQPAPLKLCWQVLEDVKQFQRYVPLAVCMCNRALRRRHWLEMSAIAGFDLTPNAGTTLRKITRADLMGSIERYEAISTGADKELELQRRLSGMIREWDELELKVAFLEFEEIYGFENLETMEMLVEDHLVRIQEMRASYFIKPIEREVLDFLGSLTRIRDLLERWRDLQVRRNALDPIFSSPVRVVFLQKEKQLFRSVEETLKLLNQSLVEVKCFRELTRATKILERLQAAAGKIERINEGIAKYLDDIRRFFPRFFFLSDSELAKMLFQRDVTPGKVESFLEKFSGTRKLRVDGDLNICKIRDEFDEELGLKEKVPTIDSSGCAEQWLKKLESVTLESVKLRLQDCLENFGDYHLKNWMKKVPSMILLCVLDIRFTSFLERKFKCHSLEAFPEVTSLKEDLSNLITDLRTERTRKERRISASVIRKLQQQLEILRMLEDGNVTQREDFSWKSQLRFYQNDVVQVEMINTSINYGYEFSSSHSMTATPLTERCFRTVLEAFRHHYYSLIAGRASTGKTEAFRSLVKSLALQNHVLHGDPGVSKTYIRGILKGLISCGAWVCFKDFDSIQTQILSVVSRDILQILNSMAIKCKTIDFHGHKLDCEPTGYLCVTVTSATFKKDLPNGLKAIFRPVAMPVPDFRRICEIELFVSGFRDAGELSRKIQIVFRTSGKLLDAFDRRSFYLDHLKSVLRTASDLKRVHWLEDESVLIIRALVDNLLANLEQREAKVFQHILQDVFPDATMPSPDYKDFLLALEEVCQERHLSLHGTFQLKVIQLLELFCQKSSLMVTGEPLAGKSTILSCLLDTMRRMDPGCSITCDSINPQTLDIHQLYGHFQRNGKEWQDGICVKLLRSFLEAKSRRSLLIFDGTLHPIWTETLSTLLGVDRVLFLPTGERIQLTRNQTLVFECSDLREASPGILSRCGIVYVDASPGWQPWAFSLLRKDPFKDHSKKLQQLFDFCINPCLNFIRNHCTVVIRLGENHLARNLLQLFKIFLLDGVKENVGGPEVEKHREGHFLVWSQAALLLSLSWSLGGVLEAASRKKFNDFCLTLWSGVQKLELSRQFELSLPTEGLIQDHFYVFKGAGTWKHFGDTLKAEKIPTVDQFGEMLVPTLDTLKYLQIFQKQIQRKVPFLVVGPPGSGKTSCMKEFLNRRLPEQEFSVNSFYVSSLSASVKSARNIFLSRLTKVRKGVFVPANGRVCVNFIDDLSFDVTESQIHSLELIRQYRDHGFWHGSQTGKIFLSEVTFLLASSISSKVNLDPRFLRHFVVHSFCAPSRETIFRIFSNVLFANLKENGFNADVVGTVNGMVNVITEVYVNCSTELRPVPSKLQYQFSTKDISRVLQGCCLVQKKSVETKITFVRLLVHEVLRVFADRMADAEDKKWLLTNLRKSVKVNFKDSFESVFDHLPKLDNQLALESFRDLVFCNFVEAKAEARRYEEVNGLEALKNTVLGYVNDYNDKSEKKFDIVLSTFFLEHLVRICRILATPTGNLVMIGSSTGRKLMTRLAAHIQGQEFFEIFVDRLYDLRSWRNDLKKVLRKSGNGLEQTFFLNERQIQEEYLPDVRSLLEVGEIPQLFSSDETQGIMETVRINAQGGNRNQEISVAGVWKYFVHQCKRNLHFVLNLGNHQTRILKSCPVLLRNCSLDWHEDWPEEVFMQISRKFVSEVTLDEKLRTQLVASSVRFYQDLEKRCQEYRESTFNLEPRITPSLFLHMTRLFTELMLTRQTEITAARRKYLNGLEKLQLAAEEVAKMKSTLTVLRPQLEESSQQTAATMRQIENENVSLEQATAIVKLEEEIANRKAAIAGTLRTECEADLAVAIPILEDAVAALNTLKPTDITLVKAMKNPPDNVKLVMAAVCVMLDVAPDRSIDPVTGKKFTDYWAPSKRLLGDMNFLQNLKDYDKDNIPSTLMSVIKKTYMSDKSFMPHIVAKASSAAEGLCKWVRAMVSYDDVVKVVNPKKEKLAAAQKECDETEAFLTEKRRTLSDLNVKLATLNSNLEDTLGKKLQLENEVAECTRKLRKAEKLLDSLGGEKMRWESCEKSLEASSRNLAGDLLISAGFVAFLTPFNIRFRDQMVTQWGERLWDAKVPHSQGLQVTEVLGDEGLLSSWHSQGLSKHRFSRENALAVEHSKLWCLFVDSESQAGNWIKRTQQGNDLKVLRVTDANFMEVVLASMELGNAVLLENLPERLDPSLDPILRKDVYRRGDSWVLDFAGKAVPYNPKFRLFLTTRLSNPRFSPEVYSKLTVIDFSVPMEALEDRFLDIVVSRERPELQAKFEALLQQSSEDKRALKEVEEHILDILSSSSVKALEDEKTISVLDSSKKLSLEIKQRQENSRMISEELEGFRVNYRGFTSYSSTLYSTLQMLPALNHMYRFSLAWFTQLFVRSIDCSNRSVILERRLQFLKASLTRKLHASVRNSLLEKHKLVYSFTLCVRTLLDSKKISQTEIEVFKNRTECESAPGRPDWLSDKTWTQIYHLSINLEIFRDLGNDFQRNTCWKWFMESDAHEFPTPWSERLSSFQKLILLERLKPKNLRKKLREFIAQELEMPPVNTPLQNFMESYEDSTCLSPLVLVLSGQRDPFPILSRFAELMGYSSKLVTIPVGKDQEFVMESSIRKAQESGEWLFLENYHLALERMSFLESLCEGMSSSNISMDFRLWISSYPTNHFPVSILQNGVKITCDAPEGLRENLLQLYRSEPINQRDFFQGCPGKDKTFLKLLYSLCCFHVVVQKRKNFGIHSWNVSYDFLDTDLILSLRQLQWIVNEYTKVPLGALFSLTEANYAGRIKDDLDSECLRAILESFCNSQVIQNPEKCEIPSRCEYEDHLKHIQDLPRDDFGVYGFDRSIEALQECKFVDEFTSNIRERVSENLEYQEIDVETNCREILAVLPEEFDIVNLEEKFPLDYLEPMNLVLLKELRLHNFILRRIKSSLSRSLAVIRGEVEQSSGSSIEDFFRDIYFHRIPSNWRNLSLDSSSDQKNLSTFVENLLEQQKFLSLWVEKVEICVFPSRALNFCSALLLAVKQRYCRKYKRSVEEEDFRFQVVPEFNETEQPVNKGDGIYLLGVVLTGAKWDSETLSLVTNENKIVYQKFPVLQYKLDITGESSSRIFDCPLYKSTGERNKKSNSIDESFNNNYICRVNLKSEVSKEFWIKRGTALFCRIE